MALDFECSFQVPAFVVAILAWIISWVAILTPSWQVVYVRELQQWIQSGLWLNCQTRPSGMYTCTYTFSESDFNFYTSAEIVDWRTPPFYSWQRRLLAVYLGGQTAAFVALISFCCSLQASGRKLSSLVFVGAIAVALILHAGASVVFMFFSQLVEYRFYHVSVSGIYEKHRGYSVYTEFFAIFLFLISLILAVVHIIQGQRSGYPEGPVKYTDSFVDVGPYRHVESYYPRPGSSSSQLDPFESRFAMRELPPLPDGRRR
ncbi:hypothetical protein FO519_008329 [Halicephalobus sp. NKZ332]|nr:hypothetical protein FO519_008329 [Halicephalobus sp. NKZ332]